MRIWLQARVNEAAALRGAVDPDGGGDEPLHQKAFRWADIGLIERHASLAEQLFIAHQLTMGATVEAINRLAVEIFQLKRGHTPAVFAAQQLFHLFDVGFRNKGHGFLRGQRNVQRTAVGCQPERDLGALRGIPPVSGQ